MSFEEEGIWKKQDAIISQLVRTGEMNLAVEAGKVRDYLGELLRENEAYKAKVRDVIARTYIPEESRAYLLKELGLDLPIPDKVRKGK